VAVSQQAFAPVNYGIGKQQKIGKAPVTAAVAATKTPLGITICPRQEDPRRNNPAAASFRDCLTSPAMTMMCGWVTGAMTVTNGLYSIQTEMKDGGHGHATGVIVLLDGKIVGGDSNFYYTGSYIADRGKWRGELTTNQHTKSAGVLPLFGGREVTTGFMGTYSADAAVANGIALVGKTSVLIETKLTLLSAL
jgi:hypothetical protein